VGATQIGELKTSSEYKGKKSGKIRPVITSGYSRQWAAEELLDCRREYWAIEAKLHKPLNIILNEDRSRVRKPKGLVEFH